MFESLKFTSVKSNIFSTITFALFILVIIFVDSIISNVSLQSKNQDNNGYLTTPHLNLVRREKLTIEPQITRIKPAATDEFNLFQSSRFQSRLTKFFSTNQCKVHFFMTWISPTSSFGQREFFGLESLFQTNPTSCLIILSNTMDSKKGYQILKPLIDRGFLVKAITPNLFDLVNNTPGQIWLNDIKNGDKDAGEIPLPQNLSNLMRLAVLYKYGGVYLDTDFIVLKDFSTLRNSIGAQSVDINGNWTRLNNALLVFDKEHPLVYKFIKEFALTFDGNKWGHNGPYLVSRVVERVAQTREFNFTVLPPLAFYPVDWTRVAKFFERPTNRADEKWVDAKIRQLSSSTYGVHLWNKESIKFKIEQGSIISKLISAHCVICNKNFATSQ